MPWYLTIRGQRNPSFLVSASRSTSQVLAPPIAPPPPEQAASATSTTVNESFSDGTVAGDAGTGEPGWTPGQNPLPGGTPVPE